MPPVASDPSGTLVLAPHPDDAAFSLGGAILGRQLPAPVTVVTLFGRSNYAGGQFHPDADCVTALRQAEDEQWARSAGVRLVYLDRPEAALRTGSSFDDVFGPPDFDHLAIRETAETIRALVIEEKPRLLLAPLAIGSHCDHVIVRELVKSFSREADIVTAFYEDLPYADEASSEEIARAVSEALPDPWPLVLPLRAGMLDRKCDSLPVYASQIEDAVLHAVRRHSLGLGHADGAERLWFAAADSGVARTLA